MDFVYLVLSLVLVALAAGSIRLFDRLSGGVE
jgi:hypothetical protein